MLGVCLEINRRWEPGDRVSLQLDLALRPVSGAREQLGKVSIYRGPLLLAYDQSLNDFDEASTPPLDLRRLAEAREISARKSQETNILAAWIVLELPAENAGAVHVCDFASAGARGTRYRSWLPAAHPLPPPVVTRTPVDGAVIPIEIEPCPVDGPEATRGACRRISAERLARR